jgi:hypothetical protein
MTESAGYDPGSKKAEEGSTHHAYLFALKESAPEGFKRQMEMEADELKGQIVGNAVLQNHQAYLERKREQQEQFFDFVDRNRRASQ